MALKVAISNESSRIFPAVFRVLFGLSAQYVTDVHVSIV